jgi:hypothetical protein
MTNSAPRGNRPVADRRRTPRYPFVATAEIAEVSSGTRMYARVSDLSLYGCYLDMSNPLPSGAHVFVKIFTDADFFEADASVVYSQPNLGVGLAFRDVKPHFLPTLQKWLLQAMQETLKEVP